MIRARFLPHAGPAPQRGAALHARAALHGGAGVGAAAAVAGRAIQPLRTTYRAAARRHDASAAWWAAAAAAATLLAVLQVADTADRRPTWDVLQAVVPSALVSASLAVLARRHAGPLAYRSLAAAAAVAIAGMLSVFVAPWIGDLPASVAANAWFAVAAVIGFPAVLSPLWGRMDRRAAIAVGLDGLVMLLAGMTVLVAVWRHQLGTLELSDLLIPVLATTLFASAGTAGIAALALRAEPKVESVWCGIAGCSILGLAWIVWIDRLLHGTLHGSPELILFSAGFVVVSYGWRTWNDRVGRGRVYERVASGLADWLPNAAILICAGLLALPRRGAVGLDPAALGTAAVVLVAVARYRFLLLNERATARRLEREMEERAATTWSLARLEPGATVAETAVRICEEALRLPGIETATMYAFTPAGTGVVLADVASADVARADVAPADVARAGGEWTAEGATPDARELDRLTDQRTLYLRANASLGPWLDAPQIAAATRGRAILRTAFAPLRWDEDLAGVIAMGTADRSEALALADRMSSVTEFGVVSSALLGPMLADHWRRAALREELESVIAARAFVPVFQPILELSTRRVVGYEALTRFSDGTRPDKRFAEAGSIGLAVRLETACLVEQLEAGSCLPDGTWLSVNVSPDLVSAVIPLVAALERTDRQLVVEVTEHVEIADYRELGRALEPIRTRARLAVDDAGAGYAGLRHILELRPQFVKLDISLVRSIDADPARQAMVAGIAHFAANAGCDLIAEGIETPEELAELVRLGVLYGQGYLLGRPAPLA